MKDYVVTKIDNPDMIPSQLVYSPGYPYLLEMLQEDSSNWKVSQRCWHGAPLSNIKWRLIYDGKYDILYVPQCKRV